MMRRRSLYLALSAFALLFVALSIAASALSHITLAWCFAIAVVLCMEGRVQVRKRLPRTFLVWLHLALAISFFIAFSLFVFIAHAPPFNIVSAVLGMAALASALPLWYRGVRNELEAAAPIDATLNV